MKSNSLHSIHELKSAGFERLLALKKASVAFTVPEDYFQLNEESVVQSISGQEPDLKLQDSGMEVPEDYFVSFAERLNKTIQFLDQDDHSLPEVLLDESGKKLTEGFARPNDSLKGLGDLILAKAKAQEADDTTEVLEDQELRFGESFSLPEGYFETFSDRLGGRLESTATTEGKVIELSRWRKGLKYVGAVAAIFTVFFIGTFIYTNSERGFDLEQELAQLNDEELNEALEFVLADYDGYDLLENVSDFNIFSFTEFEDDFIDSYLLEEVDIEALKDFL